MRKNFFKVICMAMAVLSFTACNEDTENRGWMDTYVTDGAWVVCTGNQSKAIDGGLTYYDYSNGQVVDNVFSQVNGRSLGLTANDGMVYGNKIYVVVDKENSIEVLDRSTMKSITRISTTDLLGAKEGASPRHIIAGHEGIYFTTYGGYVAQVDTVNFKLVNKWQVGSYPEGLAGYMDYIYVANSDYGKGNGTISIIDLANNKVTTETIEGIENPQQIDITPTGSVYVLDWGHYTSDWSKQEGAGLKLISAKKVVSTIPATLADFVDGKFYIINAPYGVAEKSYSVYDISTATSTPFAKIKVDDPCAIKVDPIRNYIYVLSRKMGEYGYADYAAPGYGKVYTTKGDSINYITTGVGPTTVFFNTRATRVELR